MKPINRINHCFMFCKFPHMRKHIVLCECSSVPVIIILSCFQGTVNPTHYIVLKNGCNLSTENVQRLSLKLCHLYYNWCGTIKVPAPVQVNIKNIFCYLFTVGFKNIHLNKMSLENQLFPG